MPDFFLSNLLGNLERLIFVNLYLSHNEKTIF